MNFDIFGFSWDLDVLCGPAVKSLQCVKITNDLRLLEYKGTSRSNLKRIFISSSSSLSLSLSLSDFHNHYLIFTFIFDNEWPGNWNVLLLARDPSQRCILAIFMFVSLFPNFHIYCCKLYETTFRTHIFVLFFHIWWCFWTHSGQF